MEASDLRVVKSLVAVSLVELPKFPKTDICRTLLFVVGGNSTDVQGDPPLPFSLFTTVVESLTVLSTTKEENFNILIANDVRAGGEGHVREG